MTNNEATESACLFLSDTSTLTTSNCLFSGNSAQKSTVFQAILDATISDSECFSHHVIEGSTMTGNQATITNSVGLFSGTSGSVFDGTNITYNTLVVGDEK